MRAVRVIRVEAVSVRTRFLLPFRLPVSELLFHLVGCVPLIGANRHLLVSWQAVMHESGHSKTRFICITLGGKSLVWLALLHSAGCGVVKSRSASEQLLVSDAVDRSVAQIDFRPLTGRKVYLDTQFIKPVKGIGFVNSDYIISSLRQQMVAANCMLEDSFDKADYIVEARVGALGTDDHEVNYGLPASNAISAATSILSLASAVPAIPEISFAKRNDFRAAAKLVGFAYDRRTKRPIWQSGLSKGLSTAKAMWVLGAGPFQRGTIYDGTQFAGARIHVSALDPAHRDEMWTADSYYQTRDFQSRGQIARIPAPSGETATR